MAALPTVPARIPDSKRAAAHTLSELGAHLTAYQRIERRKQKKLAALEREIAELKRACAAEQEPIWAAIETGAELLRAYVAAHQHELFSGRRKSIRFPGAEIGLYDTPPAVTVLNEQALIRELRRKRLVNMIRVKETVNKQAILAHPEEAASLRHARVAAGRKLTIAPPRFRGALALEYRFDRPEEGWSVAYKES